MNLRYLYLILCCLGLVLPYSQFVLWVLANGFNPSLFLYEMFANRISGFFAMDVLVSAVVLVSFVISESERLHLRMVWLPLVATCLVGVSLGLPLFLYLRQVHLENDGHKLVAR